MSEVNTGNQLILPVGEDLVLRQFVQSDAELLHATIQGCTDHLGKFDNPTPSRYDTIESTQRQIRIQDERFRILGMWSGELLVGAVSYCTVEQGEFSSSAEMGYWVAEEYTGNGFAHRSAEAVADYLLEQPDVHSVGAYIRLGNIPSAGTAQKAGLKYLGSLINDIDGDYWLFGKYKMLPSELEGHFEDDVLRVETLQESSSKTIAKIRLDGVNRPVINHGAETMYEVLMGDVTIMVEGEPCHLTEGHKITIPKGTAYQDVGNTVMYATSIPAFDPEQVEFLR